MYINKIIKKIYPNFKESRSNLSLLTIIFILSISGNIFCQNPQDYFDQSVDKNFSISHFNNENGLKQIIVNDIILDQFNFLWLSTPSGVVRFDGSKFTYFNSGLGDQSRAKRIFKSHKYPDTYYVKFPKGPMGKISNGTFALLNHSEEDNIYPFEARVVERDSTYDFDNFLKTREHKTIIDFYPVDSKSQYIRDIESISYIQNGKEIATYSDPLLSPKAFYETSKPHFQFDDYFISLRKDARMVVLKAGVLQRTIKIKNSLPFRYKDLQSTEIKIIQGAKAKTAFLEVRGDLFQINLHNENIDFMPLGIKTNIPLISGIEITSDGKTILISSVSSGIFLLKKKIFSDSYTKSHPISQSYQSHIELPDGKILTNHNTIIEENLTPRIKDIKGGANFFKLNPNSYYVVNRANTHVYNYDFKTENVSLFYQDENARQINSCILGRDGQLWINKIMQVDKLDEVGYIDIQGTYQKVVNLSFRVRSFNWTPFNKLQLNTDSCIYYLDTIDYSLDTLYPPTNLEIRDVQFLNDSLSILTTYNNGLWFLQNEKFYKLDISNDKLNEANTILKDKQGYIWVSTNNGLFKFEPNTLETYVRKPFHQIYYTYYDRSFGYSNNEFNGGEYGCSNVLSDGRLSFSSVQGIVIVDPKKTIKSTSSPSKIVINTYVDDRLLQTENELNPNFQRIIFSVSSPNYDHEDNLHVYYRLKGFDKKWNNYSSKEPINYTQLKPGKYSFEVKQLLGPNKDDVVYRQIDFSVKKKWFQSKWAIFSLFLLITLAYFLVYKLRVQYYKKQKQNLEKVVHDRTKEISIINKQLNSSNSVKNKLLGIISHEIVGSIQMIHNTSKFITASQEQIDTSDLMEFMYEIKDTSKNTNDILRNILTWAKSQNEEIKLQLETVNVHQSIVNILSKIESQAREKSIKISNEIPPSFQIKADKNILTLVVHSLLENEIKHNSNTTILLTTSHIQAEFDIEIITNNDNGTLDVNQANGFFKSESKEMNSSVLINGLGFWIIKDLLQKSNGSILFIRKSVDSHRILLKL